MSGDTVLEFVLFNADCFLWYHSQKATAKICSLSHFHSCS